MIVKCPQCGRPAEYVPTNPFRPFCSERCRLIDLGQWADESYKIPVRPRVDDGNPADDVDSSEEPNLQAPPNEPSEPEDGNPSRH